MKIESIEKIFAIADAAKDVGEYELANDCFAVISDSVLSPEWRESGIFTRFYYEYSEDDIVVSLYSPMREGYYDLIAVRVERDYLCIPYPLLSAEFVNKVLRENLISFIPRLEHRRERLLLSDEQRNEAIADLRRRLAEEVDEETIIQCRKILFVEEVVEDVE